MGKDGQNFTYLRLSLADTVMSLDDNVAGQILKSVYQYATGTPFEELKSNGNVFYKQFVRNMCDDVDLASQHYEKKSADNSTRRRNGINKQKYRQEISDFIQTYSLNGFADYLAANDREDLDADTITSIIESNSSTLAQLEDIRSWLINYKAHMCSAETEVWAEALGDE